MNIFNIKDAKKLLPVRKRNSNKGTYGKVLIIAGSKEYVGAAYLSSMAAYRTGAGLVTLAIKESIQPLLSSKLIEPIFLFLPENNKRELLFAEAAKIILDDINKYDSVLIGCGLGTESSTQEFLKSILFSEINLPKIIIDADGLNILANMDNWWTKIKNKVIITPHPGELSRLLKVSKNLIQKNREKFAREAAKKFNKIIVLKGSYPIVAFPNKDNITMNFANPLLSTAGTGDVKAGIIVGFLAQGLNLYDATLLGVFIHGKCGENLIKTYGDCGLIASDMLDEIPKTIKQIKDIEYHHD